MRHTHRYWAAYWKIRTSLLFNKNMQDSQAAIVAAKMLSSRGVK